MLQYLALPHTTNELQRLARATDSLSGRDRPVDCDIIARHEHRAFNVRLAAGDHALTDSPLPELAWPAAEEDRERSAAIELLRTLLEARH
jgi:hypothetical protein